MKIQQPSIIDDIVNQDAERLPMFMDRTASNHLSITVLCMSELGATASEVRSFEQMYLAKRHEQLPFLKDIPDDIMCKANNVDYENWKTRLADRNQLSNMRNYFREQLKEKGIKTVLTDCLTVLEPWFHYGQAAPLSRIYFTAVFCDSKYLLEADGLAYLADWVSYQKSPPATPLPKSNTSSKPWTPEDLEDVWSCIKEGVYKEILDNVKSKIVSSKNTQKAQSGIDLHPHHDGATAFASGMLPTFPEIVTIALKRPGSDIVSSFDEQALPLLLPQLCRLAVSLFLAVPCDSTLHGVTVTQSMAHLCIDGSILTQPLQATLFTRMWIWLTGIYIDKNVTPASFRSPEDARRADQRVDWDWLELSSKAIKSNQANIIKLVFSCKWIYENIISDPLFRLAAARAIEGGHPWRTDVPMECELLLKLPESAKAFRMEMKGKAIRYVASLIDNSSEEGINAWELAWREKTTPWDLTAQRNNTLRNHTTNQKIADDARCLVPGCGGGRDIIDIIEGGKNRIVHGIEISETATEVANANIRSFGYTAKIFDVDFFNFIPPNDDQYDFIFDYTFFCALPLDVRTDWGLKMSQLTRQQTGKLLTYIWPPASLSKEPTEKPKGPPFPVNIDNYETVLSPAGFYLDQAEICLLDQGRQGVAALWNRSAQNDQDIDDIRKVYSFWFRSEDNSYNFDAIREGFDGKSQGIFWMMTAEVAVDDAIRDEFLDLFERITIHDSNAQNRWMETPRGCIALTILTDQLPRNMFRGTSRSFATDLIAIQSAEAGLNHLSKWDTLNIGLFQGPLNLCERWFLSLVFTHSENMEHQQEGIKLLQQMLPVAVAAEDSSDPISSALASNDLTLSQVQTNIEQAKAHAKLIDKYGRFPYRDEILSRTPASDYEPTQRFEKSVKHN